MSGCVVYVCYVEFDSASIGVKSSAPARVLREERTCGSNAGGDYGYQNDRRLIADNVEVVTKAELRLRQKIFLASPWRVIL